MKRGRSGLDGNTAGEQTGSAVSLRLGEPLLNDFQTVAARRGQLVPGEFRRDLAQQVDDHPLTPAIVLGSGESRLEFLQQGYYRAPGQGCQLLQKLPQAS